MVMVAELDPSLDLEYTSETTGEVTVYNLGNIAWSESLTFVFLGSTWELLLTFQS